MTRVERMVTFIQSDSQRLTSESRDHAEVRLVAKRGKESDPTHHRGRSFGIKLTGYGHVSYLVNLGDDQFERIWQI